MRGSPKGRHYRANFLLLCDTRATQVPSLLSVSDLTGRDCVDLSRNLFASRHLTSRKETGIDEQISFVSLKFHSGLTGRFLLQI